MLTTTRKTQLSFSSRSPPERSGALVILSAQRGKERLRYSMDAPESRGTESEGSSSNPSLSSPTNVTAAQSAPAEGSFIIGALCSGGSLVAATSVGEMAPPQPSHPPALSLPAGASNVPHTASTSAQRAPSPDRAATSIIVPFLLAEHQERTARLRATQERVVRLSYTLLLCLLLLLLFACIPLVRDLFIHSSRLRHCARMKRRCNVSWMTTSPQ